MNFVFSDEIIGKKILKFSISDWDLRLPLKSSESTSSAFNAPNDPPLSFVQAPCLSALQKFSKRASKFLISPAVDDRVTDCVQTKCNMESNMFGNCKV